jgi:heat shock protein HtpX
MFGNWLKTSILMAGIVALFGAIGAPSAAQQGMLIALVIGGAMNFFAYWFSDKMVLRCTTRAKSTRPPRPISTTW